ncbi:MAG: hypothetical protein Phog2KO_19310 [Phototrophicaceae bacterium]
MPKPINMLKQYIEIGTANDRLYAVPDLLEHKTDEALQLLIQLADDEDGDVQIEAIKAIAQLGEKQVFSALEPFLRRYNLSANITIYSLVIRILKDIDKDKAEKLINANHPNVKLGENSHYFGVYAHFTRAHDFFTYLQPTNPHWYEASSGKSWGNSWLFRGQGNSQWKLLPSAWRKNENNEQNQYIEKQIRRLSIYNQIGDGSDDKTDRVDEIILQACAEYKLILEFTKFADRLGHHVPSIDKLPIFDEFVPFYLKNLFDNPLENLNLFEFWSHPIFALAQHHGIPTRLIDWSWNPLKAAYFAAETAMQQNNSENIIIYAIPNISEKYYRQVFVNANQNQYLQAQEGLFVVDIWSDWHFLETGIRQSLGESINSTKNHLKKPNVINLKSETLLPRLYTLPSSEAPELLRLLWLAGISKAHLMPTLDNVANAMKMKWDLDNRVAEDFGNGG